MAKKTKTIKFFRKENVIKPEFKNNDYCIQAFNIFYNNNGNHFIEYKDWVNFEKFMIRNKPEVLLILELN